jgi:hypothetical protein
LRGVVLPIVLCLAPLALYAYVPWAGGRGLPPGSWPVDTPAAFVEFLLDRGYTSQIRPDAAFNGRLLEEARVLLRSFGPLGVALGLVGIVVSCWRDWRIGIVLLLTFAPQAVIGASYVLESNYALPRHWVFFLPAFLIWSVWLGIGLQRVADHLQRRVSWRPVLLTSGIVALVLLIQAGTAWARGAILLVRAEAGAETMDAWRQDLQRSPVAERFGRLAMDLAAQNAVIVCDWEQATVLWYFQRVERMRSDLTIRYPIERLDQTLAEAHTSGQTVYIARTLPGVESRGVTSSVGPLIRVYAPRVGTNPGMEAGTLLAPSFEEAAALFGDGLSLTNVAIHEPAISPGGVVPFTLYWQANVPLAEAYAVSVRLLGQDGDVLASHDERHPVLGTSPTNRWQPGVVVGDYHELPVGSLLRPGQYRIQVVPYRADGSMPLPVLAVPPFPQNVARADEVGISLPLAVEPRTRRRPLDLLASLLAR